MENSFFYFDLEGFVVLEGAQGFVYENDTKLAYRIATDVASKALKVCPPEQDIVTTLIECVTETLDALQIV